MRGDRLHQAMRIVRFMLEIQREKLAENKDLTPSQIIPLIYQAQQESIEVLREGNVANAPFWEDVLRRETLNFIKQKFGNEYLGLDYYCNL